MPRSGSTYLTHLLDSHPQIICHKEIFAPYQARGQLSTKSQPPGGDPRNLLYLSRAHIQQTGDYRPYLNYFWRHNGGMANVGFKLSTRQLYDIQNRENFMASNPKIILLTRQNRLRQAVSWLRITEVSKPSLNYSHFYTRRTGDGQEQVVPFNTVSGHVAEIPENPKQRLTFSYESIVEAARDTEEKFQAALDWLEKDKLDYLKISYEELIANRDTTLSQILDYLNIDASVAHKLSSPSISVYEGAPLPDVLANYDEIAAKVKNTDLEQYLEQS